MRSRRWDVPRPRSRCSRSARPSRSSRASGSVPTQRGGSAGLLLGGVAATAVAFSVVFPAVQRYSYLPESRSAYELLRFDLDLYVWFVLALAGTSTAAAGTAGRRSLSVLAASPLFQAAVPLAFISLEQWFAGRGGV